MQPSGASPLYFQVGAEEGEFIFIESKWMKESEHTEGKGREVQSLTHS